MRLGVRVEGAALPPENVAVRVVAREGLSTLFDVLVEFTCQDADLDLTTAIWSEALVTLHDLQDPSGEPLRCFHGVIEHAEYVRKRALEHLYRIRLKPRLHGLAHRVRTRIFQELSTPDIVKKVLEEAGVPADSVDWQIARSYPVREYCTQWKESELAFVSRLLEEEGIFTWHEHDLGDHVLKLGDTDAAFRAVDDDLILPFTRQQPGDTPVAYALAFRAGTTHGAYHARDWNFEAPANPIAAENVLQGDSALERYEYPGSFSTPDDGAAHAKCRLAEEVHRRYVLTGRSNSVHLAPGRLFTLQDVQPGDLAGDHLVLEAEHRYARPEDGNATFVCEFRAIPAGTAFHPPRRTPRPRVAGKESAVVTGPPGEEIHVDEYGRIKVHFAWDREGAVDDKASCWMRVQQQNTSGAMILPRVGWEVDVGFLHGDPDRPIVLQKMYNRETLPPYGLPDNKTQSALQSSTSPGGAGVNEIRLQDGNGGMDFYVHASRDYQLVAGNNLDEDIAVDAKEEVGLALSSSVKGSETVTVGANQAVSVTANLTHDVGGSRTVSVGANDDWGITGTFVITTSGSRTENIGSLMNVLANKVNERIKGSLTRNVGAVQALNAASGISESVGGSKTETVAAAKLLVIGGAVSEQHGAAKVLTSGVVMIKTGGDITISAKGAVALTSAGPIIEKVGGSFTIKAKNIMATAGVVTLKAGGSKFGMTGGALSVNASALAGKGGPKLQLKGNINYK